MNYAFLLNPDRTPQALVPPGQARALLRTRQAAVLRRYPFALILQPGTTPAPRPLQPVRLKIDPGSKTTGLALLQGDAVVWAAELTHRGSVIRERLRDRANIRRSRRKRHTRYREPRFDNRRRPDGWLAPSLLSRVYNVMTWVRRLQRMAPITAISVETVRFDMQKMENPEISGVEYQRGTLWECEIREYLYEKWKYTCAYCRKKNPPYEVEHVIPKARGGTNRISNLVLTCKSCNDAKGNKTAAEFGYPRIQQQCKIPLRDAAAVNSTRKELYRQLCATGLPVEVSTGGRTRFNRKRLGVTKAHWIDAACVGASTPEHLRFCTTQPLRIQAKGHGDRRMIGRYDMKTDKRGKVIGTRFPLNFEECKAEKARRKALPGKVTTRTLGIPLPNHRTHHKLKLGFQTGDIVRGIAKGRKHRGVFVGRIAEGNAGVSGAVRTAPERGIKQNKVSIRYANMTMLHATDGYDYTFTPPAPLAAEEHATP